MSDSSQEHVSNPAPARGGLAVAALLTTALVLLAAWWLRSDSSRRPASDRTTLAGTPLPDESPFAGSHACRACHPGEFAGHDASGHARTLRRGAETNAARAIAGRTFDDPKLAGEAWVYRVEDGSLIAERSENGVPKARHTLDVALGSGVHAITFVSLKPRPDGPPEGLEHRLTYYRHDGSMAVTPGQAAARDQPGRGPDGFMLPPALLLDCLSCHGMHTAPVSGGLRPETFVPNIHCERCHGPARGHVEQARAGVTSARALALPFGPDRAGAAEQVEMCGRCHRLPSMVPAGSIVSENAALARFPSVGLLQSPCYTKSDGRLSCTTCHDPHARAASAANRYEAACVECHDSAQGGVVCSVNPASGCVGCHMPRREAGYGLEFTDHWIRR